MQHARRSSNRLKSEVHKLIPRVGVDKTEVSGGNSTTLPLNYEQKHSKGRSVVVGVDEAGRGPLAGPVVAAACAIIDSLGGK